MVLVLALCRASCLCWPCYYHDKVEDDPETGQAVLKTELKVSTLNHTTPRQAGRMDGRERAGNELVGGWLVCVVSCRAIR